MTGGPSLTLSNRERLKIVRFLLAVFMVALDEVGFTQAISGPNPGPNVSTVACDPFSQKQLEVDASANPLNANHIFARYITYQTAVENSNKVTSKGAAVIPEWFRLL